jgi:hypothetical protein
MTPATAKVTITMQKTNIRLFRAPLFLLDMFAVNTQET